MIAWKTTAWNHTVNDRAKLPVLEADSIGFLAGTKVATAMGWRPVEAVCAGDQVLTFDGGLQVVTSVTRHLVAVDADAPASWPLFVPAGVLGNREDMQVLPAQAILIESDLAEEMLGDPFALVPGAALDGFRGITRTRPTGMLELIELHFDRDEIVFANIGALFFCRAKRDLIADPVAAPDYEVLPLDQADLLVDYLDMDTAPPRHATASAGQAAQYAAA